MPGGVPSFVGLVYLSTAILCLAIIGGCAAMFICYIRLSRAPLVLPATGDPAKLALKMGRRDAATVRTELVEALTQAENLKAELDAIMAEQTQMTGPSMALGPYAGVHYP